MRLPGDADPVVYSTHGTQQPAFVAWKDYKAVTVTWNRFTAHHGRRRVAGAGCVREGMGCTDPQISRSWRANWPNVATFFATRRRSARLSTPAWSSFGNKTSGAETSGSMIPQPEVISKKGQGNHSVQKHAQRAAEREWEKRTEAGKRLSAAIAAREKDETHENTPYRKRRCRWYYTTGVRLLQAELREYGFRTEIAGYMPSGCIQRAGCSWFSSYISPEARSLIEQAEKRQKDAQNAARRPLICLLNTSAEKVFWTRVVRAGKKWRGSPCRSWCTTGRLLEQQTRNDRAISEARNKPVRWRNRLTRPVMSAPVI